MEAVTMSAEGVSSYLKQPYSRLMIPEPDGTFRGEMLEFPGCIATGDTPEETFAALEQAATAWLEAAVERGQTIPAPVDNSEFSGRLILRLPRSLHKKASRLAERDGVSLNQFIVAGLAEHVGERTATGNMTIVSARLQFVSAAAAGPVIYEGFNNPRLVSYASGSLTMHVTPRPSIEASTAAQLQDA